MVQNLVGKKMGGKQRMFTHLHSFYPLELLFYMEYHNAHKDVPYFIDQPPKILRKNTFYASKGIQKLFPKKLSYIVFCSLIFTLITIIKICMLSLHVLHKISHPACFIIIFVTLILFSLCQWQCLFLKVPCVALQSLLSQ